MVPSDLLFILCTCLSRGNCQLRMIITYAYALWVLAALHELSLIPNVFTMQFKYFLKDPVKYDVKYQVFSRPPNDFSLVNPFELDINFWNHLIWRN